MGKIGHEKEKAGTKRDDKQLKSRQESAGQAQVKENSYAIGIILQSGGSLTNLSQGQLQLLKKSIGNTMLLRLLNHKSETGSNNEVWSPESLLSDTDCAENEIASERPPLYDTPRFEAADVASISPSEPFAGEVTGGSAWTGL